ncbi:amino acid transporter [Cryobacterium roopkundense]|uniref:Amino acid transporter n=1 Tax=Cryobacterium roopkundense TaxID=1001240 RepID=A0A7W8ZY47_9MICO|nr:amino acid transporter [Cryobacterium roopkundense]
MTGPALARRLGLTDAVVIGAAGWAWAVPIVGIGALLALITGVGRTSLAMARNRDLPVWLAAVHPRYGVPRHAEIALAVVVSVLVVMVDLRGAIGFSSFGVLLYYFVANGAACTQTGAHRRYPRTLQIGGAVACLVLVATLPIPSIVGGILVLTVGVCYRVARLGLARSADSEYRRESMADPRPHWPEQEQKCLSRRTSTTSKTRPG